MATRRNKVRRTKRRAMRKTGKRKTFLRRYRGGWGPSPTGVKPLPVGDPVKPLPVGDPVKTTVMYGGWGCMNQPV